MVEQKRLKDIVEGAKPRSKSLRSDCPKLPPLRFTDQIEFTEITDKKEKQNLDKTGTSSAAARNSILNQTLEFHHIIPKPKTKSNVWLHFGLPADETGCAISVDIAVCKLCFKPVSAKGGCTSNLLSHLKVHHQFEYQDLIAC